MRTILMILLLACASLQLAAGPAYACPPGTADCGRGVCCPR